MKKLRVALIAPPWLAMPVEGYAGVERVVEALVKGLMRKGIEVEIFGVKGKRRLFGAKVHGITAGDQFHNILRPMYDYSLAIPCAHVLQSLRKIQADGNFDVIHDHNYFIGPSVLSQAAGLNGLPPAVHTIHGPQLTTKRHLKEGVFDNRHYWRALKGSRYLRLVPISDAIKKAMPGDLTGMILQTVHNAVDVSTLPFVNREGKKNYFITLARFAHDKGQHIVAKICARRGYRLRMAGTVATIGSARKLMFEVANPLSRYRSDEDFKYYSDKVLPYVLRNPRITYSGAIGGKRKLTFISEAKALLFPIQWEEPFGMSVIEALACGTPVIAMKRGAMPEIIEHGVTGFLANNEEEFAGYMEQINEIDPMACRQAVKDKFSDDRMTERYIQRYEEVIRLAES